MIPRVWTLLLLVECGVFWYVLLKLAYWILAGMDLTRSLSNDILSLSELQYLDLSNSKGLIGTLPSLIGNLNQLTTLILSDCSFFGPIPDSIGSLQQLVFLALNANSFSGSIPPSIGNLSNLSWLDLTENQLNGTIPVSSGSTTGLDMLVKARHLCFNWNSLNGPVPSNLNNLTSLRELLVFDDVWKHICQSRSSVELFIYFLN